jgi:hypothetical protein
MAKLTGFTPLSPSPPGVMQGFTPTGVVPSYVSEVDDKPWYDDAAEVGRQVGAGVAVDLPRMAGQGLRVVPDTSFIDNLPRADSDRMREPTKSEAPHAPTKSKVWTSDDIPYAADLARLDGAVVIPGNSVKVQVVPHVPQTDLASGIAVQVALVIGLLLFTAVLLLNKNRNTFSWFLKPVLFIGWLIALLLGAGVLSEIKESIVASSNDPKAVFWYVGGMYGTFTALMSFLVRKIWQIKAPAAAVEQVPVVRPAPQPKQDDAIYLTIAMELDSGKTDRGLWTRLFAECDGEDAKTRVAYIRARAVQLQRSD